MASSLSLRRVQIPDEVVFRELAGETVLLHLGTGTYFGLDPVGTRIWQLLAEHHSADAIMPILLREYEVEEPRLRTDVERLIRTLLEKGLLIADAPQTSPAG